MRWGHSRKVNFVGLGQIAQSVQYNGDRAVCFVNMDRNEGDPYPLQLLSVSPLITSSTKQNATAVIFFLYGGETKSRGDGHVKRGDLGEEQIQLFCEVAAEKCAGFCTLRVRWDCDHSASFLPQEYQIGCSLSFECGGIGDFGQREVRRTQLVAQSLQRWQVLNEKTFDDQLVAPCLETNQIIVTPLSCFVCSVHSVDRPPSSEHGKYTGDQGLKLREQRSHAAVMGGKPHANPRLRWLVIIEHDKQNDDESRAYCRACEQMRFLLVISSTQQSAPRISPARRLATRLQREKSA